MDGRDLLAAAGVLFPDEEGRVLLVRVSYQAKHPIEIPGGGWEPPDLSPRATAVREIEEELGLTPRLTGLACLDWSRDHHRPPVAAFLYWAEPLTAAELRAVRLEAEELAGYAFLDRPQAASALPPLLSRRVTACLTAPRAAGPLELEDGLPVGHSRVHLTPGPPPPYTGPAGLPGLDLPAGSLRVPPPPPMDRDTYIATRPRLRAKARMLFTDPAGRVLLVRLQPRETDSEPYWSLPGGSIEADRELPRQAAAREVREELGWDREPGRLLALDWLPDPDPAQRPALVYVFDGGTVDGADLSTVRLPPDELVDCRLFEPGEAQQVLSDHSWRRVAACLTARELPGGPLELLRGRPAAAPGRPPV